MKLLRLLTLCCLCTGLLMACSPANTPTPEPTLTPTSTATVTATPEPTATPAPTATPEPSATPDNEPFFKRVANLSGLRGTGAVWDSFFRDPGAVVYHAGQFHMFYNGIDGFPRPVGVGYATSPDGISWTIQAQEPVFSLVDSHVGLYNGPNLFVTSALVEDDGTWVLYYYNIQGGDFEGKQTIGRATAPQPTGPWVADPKPVLELGPSGAWDARQVTSPNVLKTETGYVMYYEGLGQKAMIGMATSADGVNWVKYDDPTTTEPLFAESDPVLRPTDGAWDSRRTLDPNVIQTADGWVMVYTSTGGAKKFASPPFEFGYATSPDGITWTKGAENPILSSKNHPTWNGVYLVTLVKQEENLLLYFDVATGNLGTTSVSLYSYSGTFTP